MLGRRLGKYEITGLLGSGGMGHVYRARDTALDRDVAIKVLRPERARNPAAVRQFIDEARRAAGLQHPNIITVIDVGQQGDLVYIVMTAHPGQTLHELLRWAAPMSPAQVLSIVSQVSEALDRAHQADLIHLDVKPGNILVDPDGRAVLTDFGIARLWSSQEWSRGARAGTPRYMAPEQASGAPVSPATDVYALGAVAYEMLTGRPAVPAGTDLSGRPPQPVPPRRVRPEINAATERVLLRALAARPEDRFASASAFAEALREALEAQKRQPRALWAAALGLIGVILVAAVVLLPRIVLPPGGEGTGTPAEVVVAHPSATTSGTSGVVQPAEPSPTSTTSPLPSRTPEPPTNTPVPPTSGVTESPTKARVTDTPSPIPPTSTLAKPPTPADTPTRVPAVVTVTPPPPVRPPGITVIAPYEPPNGEGRTGKVWLRWNWGGALGGDQWFEVSYMRKGDTTPLGVVHTREGYLEWCHPEKGDYVWQVRLVDDAGNFLGVASAPWSFGWAEDCREICRFNVATGAEECHTDCGGCP